LKSSEPDTTLTKKKEAPKVEQKKKLDDIIKKQKEINTKQVEIKKDTIK